MMNTLGRLRAVENEDLGMMRAWRNSPSIRSKMYSRHEISYEEHQDWWNRTRDSDDKEYFIFEKNDEALGVVGFTQIDRVNQNSFWAFYANPSAPRGTGSRMEFLALEHVFNTLYLHKLSCEVLAFNEPVIRLHKKFGFREEGMFREHHKVNEDYMDIVRLGLLATDWAETREKIATMFEKT